jgi:hypothetical protein
VPLITLLFMVRSCCRCSCRRGDIESIVRAQVAIILFAAAYLAEVIRGGLQALPKGQYEAADALGLGYWQTQRLIILPQALKIAIPPIVNTFIGLFKDTSLVAIVGLTDLVLATRQALGDPEWRPVLHRGLSLHHADLLDLLLLHVEVQPGARAPARHRSTQLEATRMAQAAPARDTVAVHPQRRDHGRPAAGQQMVRRVPRPEGREPDRQEGRALSSSAARRAPASRP